MIFLSLSPTKVGTILDCGAKYQYRYMERLSPLIAPASRIMGRSIHQAIQRHLSSGELLEEAFEDIWKEVDYSRIDWGKRAKDDQSAYNAWGSKGLALAKSLSFAGLNPLEVEQSYEGIPLRDLNNGRRAMPCIRLRGRLDLVAQSQKDDKVKLIEFKTAGRRTDGAAHSLNWQPIWYLYFRLISDEPIDQLEIWELVYTKIPEIQVFPLPIDFTRLESFYHMVRFTAGLIRRGIFHQNPGIHCSWCDYGRLCRKELGASRHYYRKEVGYEAA